MTTRRPRLTVRRLMIAVASVAAVLGIGTELGRRSRMFAWLSSQHAIAAAPRIRGWPVRPDRIGQWHQDLEVKNRTAAASPWLPVRPDPPDPE